MAERLRRSTTEHDVDVIYEHKSLSDVEFSLQAKMIIDSLDITKIHIVTFSKNIGYLKELFELVRAFSPRYLELQCYVTTFMNNQF